MLPRTDRPRHTDHAVTAGWSLLPTPFNGVDGSAGYLRMLRAPLDEKRPEAECAQFIVMGDPGNEFGPPFSFSVALRPAPDSPPEQARIIGADHPESRAAQLPRHGYATPVLAQEACLKWLEAARRANAATG